MNNQILQQFEGHGIRIIQIDGIPWFVLADVCKALGLTNTSNAARPLDDSEKGLHPIKTPGGEQTLNVVSESGLFAVVLRSDKPRARPFFKWVTSEVLPQIRQTGSYTAAPALPAVPTIDMSALQEMAGLIPLAIRNEVAKAEVKFEARVQEVRAEVSAEISSKVGSLPATSEQRCDVRELVTEIVRRRGGMGLGRAHFSSVYTECWNACRVGNINVMTREQAPKVIAYLNAELIALGAMGKSGLFSETQAQRA